MCRDNNTVVLRALRCEKFVCRDKSRRSNSIPGGLFFRFSYFSVGINGYKCCDNILYKTFQFVILRLTISIGRCPEKRKSRSEWLGNC